MNRIEQQGVPVKKLFLATTAIVALTAGAASAADMSVKARPVLPPPPPACAQFGGFYFGGHLGAAYARKEVTDVDSLAWGGTIVATDSGFGGGIQGGYNWQARCAVFGFEADVSWGGKSNTFQRHLVFDSLEREADLSVERELRSFGTLRTRTGVVVDNVLLYVTGGLAWARVNTTVSFNDFVDPAVSVSDEFKSLGLDGWLRLGVGVWQRLELEV